MTRHADTGRVERGYQLRFIEQMPLDAQHGWRPRRHGDSRGDPDALAAEFSLTPDDPGARGSAPAEAFLVDGGPARVGRDRLGDPPVLWHL